MVIRLHLEERENGVRAGVENEKNCSKSPRVDREEVNYCGGYTHVRKGEAGQGQTRPKIVTGQTHSKIEKFVCLTKLNEFPSGNIYVHIKYAYQALIKTKTFLL